MVGRLQINRGYACSGREKMDKLKLRLNTKTCLVNKAVMSMLRKLELVANFSFN